MDADFKVGDKITIRGVYDDGTHEANDLPPGQYSTTKSPQWWRVQYVGPLGIKLQPINEDGSVQESRDAAGEYWIRSHGR